MSGEVHQNFHPCQKKCPKLQLKDGKRWSLSNQLPILPKYKNKNKKNMSSRTPHHTPPLPPSPCPNIKLHHPFPLTFTTCYFTHSPFLPLKTPSQLPPQHQQSTTPSTVASFRSCPKSCNCHLPLTPIHLSSLV